jgi:3-deoxy-manno-octulosonate cytidylyltransferase (CMP-KDO synthetase)
MSGFTAIVPARLGSTRYPGKALEQIKGVPMVVHSAQRAKESGAERVVVATDHDSIREAAAAAGFETVMTRSDHETGTDRLAEAVHLLNLPEDTVVANVQGDEPLLSPQLIGRVAQRLQDSLHCAMATACYPITESEHLLRPSAVKVVLNRRHEALYFSRAPIPWNRDHPPAHNAPWPTHMEAWHHVGLYAYRAGFLKQFAALEPAPLERIEGLEQLRVLWHGYAIAVVIDQKAPAPGVDTPEDMERVRTLFDLRTVSR